MKLLLVGFQEMDEKIYPHTRYFVEALGKKVEIDYYNTDEKGFFLQPYIENKFKLKALKLLQVKLYRLYLHCKKIKERDKKKNYDKILVIDDFNFWGLSLFIDPKKLVYYSYDIIGSDTKYYQNCLIKLMLKRNSELIKNGTPVIIQDVDRKKILEDSLKISIENVFYVPIFLEKMKDCSIKKQPASNPILMQTGGIDEWRLSDKLAINCNSLKGAYSLLLKGFISPSVLKIVEDFNVSYIKCNQEFLSPDNYAKIVSTCDIGFVSYPQCDLNYKYIFYANGQIPEFLRQSKPIICIGNEDFKRNVERLDIGIAIDNIEEVYSAIKKISENYSDYSKRALDCFDSEFDSGVYTNKLVEWLKNEHI